MTDTEKLAYALQQFAGLTTEDFSLSAGHRPLLFIGGTNDAIFHSSFTRRIAGSYKDKSSITDFIAFEGRSHFICGENGWEEVAGYGLNRIEKLD